MNTRDDHSQQDELLVRVGHMTRLLHDSLRGLGLDKLLERAAEDIPDARDRLDYVAKLSERAAQRVLNATDAAIPLQEALDDRAKELSGEIRALLAATPSDADYRALLAKSLISIHCPWAVNPASMLLKNPIHKCFA